MYAVIQTGGKQYTVKTGDLLKVEKLEQEVGAKIPLKVLMVVDGEKVFAGSDVLNSSVDAEVVKQGKGRKIVVFKYKAKKNYSKKQGHRQYFTELKIGKIKA